MSGRQHVADASAVDVIVERLAESEPRAGATTVVAIDGRSGAGKSTLAQALVERTGASLVQLEYLYPGWDGLDAGVDLLVSGVLAPIAAGQAVEVPQWDWYASGWGAPMRLDVPRLLVVEGVGAASASIRPYTSVTAWIDVPSDERRRRARQRDWDTYEDHWARWAAQEERLIAREGLPGTADLIIGLAASR